MILKSFEKCLSNTSRVLHLAIIMSSILWNNFMSKYPSFKNVHCSFWSILMVSFLSNLQPYFLIGGQLFRTILTWERSGSWHGPRAARKSLGRGRSTRRGLEDVSGILEEVAAQRKVAFLLRSDSCVCSLEPSRQCYEAVVQPSQCHWQLCATHTTSQSAWPSSYLQPAHCQLVQLATYY